MCMKVYLVKYSLIILLQYNRMNSMLIQLNDQSNIIFHWTIFSEYHQRYVENHTKHYWQRTYYLKYRDCDLRNKLLFHILFGWIQMKFEWKIITFLRHLIRFTTYFIGPLSFLRELI